MIHTEIHTEPFRGEDNKFYYLYKIVNNINSKYYIGIHTSSNLKDSYTGSGSRLKLAYTKYGIENFTKYIIKYFNNRYDMLEYEKLIVNDCLVNDPMCYNITNGGGIIPSLGMVVVKDSQGNILQLSKNDTRIGDEYKPINYGMVVVKNRDGIFLRVPKDDPRILSGEFSFPCSGKVMVKDKYGNIFSVSNNDPRFLSGELTNIVKGTVSVEDNNGKKFRIPKDDPRLKTGELHFHTQNRITVRDQDGNTMSVLCNDPRIGNELISINKGRIYINNGQKNKMVYEQDLVTFLNNGWKMGMKKCGEITIHKYTNDIIERKLISKQDLETYLNDGWIRGQGKTRPKSGRPKKNK